MLSVGRRRCVDRETMALGEYRDRAHIHLQCVLGSHSTDRFLVERTLVGWREQRCLKIPDKPRKGPYESVKRGREARLPPVWGTRAHDLEAL
jgi:hypothetical protein